MCKNHFETVKHWDFEFIIPENDEKNFSGYPIPLELENINIAKLPEAELGIWYDGDAMIYRTFNRELAIELIKLGAKVVIEKKEIHKLG